MDDASHRTDRSQRTSMIYDTKDFMQPFTCILCSHVLQKQLISDYCTTVVSMEHSFRDIR